MLTRQRADVSNLMYHRRINDDLLDHDLLASFDGQMRASVSASLCRDLLDHSRWQAITRVSCGGPVDHFSTAFGTLSQPILAEHDTRTAKLCHALSPPSPQPSLVAQLDEGIG